MGKSIAFSNALLALIFNGTTIAGIAENASSAPLGSFYVALHTADPTPEGNQTSNEAAYPGYARVAVVRSSLGWTVSTDFASLVNNLAFPAPTGVPDETELFFSVGTQESGAGTILYSGALTSPINPVEGVAPILGAGVTQVEEE